MRRLFWALAIAGTLLFALPFAAYAAPQKGDAWMGLRWGMNLEEAQEILGVEIIPAPPRVTFYTHTVRGWRIANQEFTVGLRFENDKLYLIQISNYVANKESVEAFMEITDALIKKYGEPKIKKAGGKKTDDIDLKYIWLTSTTHIKAIFSHFSSLNRTSFYMIYSPATKPGEGL